MMVCVSDHLLQELFIIGTAFIVVLTGGFMGIQVMKLRTLDKKVVKDRISMYEEQIKELKKELTRWRGKVGKNFQDLQVEGDFDLSEKSDLASIAKLVLPNILDILPPDIATKAKGFLDNPELIEMGLKLYEKHPEDVKLLLGKFTKGIKGNKGTKSPNSDIPGLETADESTFA